ncbi:MAG TPA: hypothetical protein VFW81_02685 [Thermoanaerobaculia bacterium]|nr:hypothetical protein [Thermoanaerobaculia bacterium]
MKLLTCLAGAVVAVTLGAGAARAQTPEPTPTPTAVPPSEVAPSAPAAPEAVPSPAVPEPTPTAVAVPPAVVPAPALPAPTSTPVAVPPAAPTPVAVAPPPIARVTDAPVVAVLQAPAENPFGVVPEAPAALPPKLTFAEEVAHSAAYVSARIDATGRIMGIRPQRDPIPSLAGESQRSLARWVFDPARKGTESVETWAAMRLDLEVEIDAPRSVQGSLTPVTPTTAVPRPFLWAPDQAWLESRNGAPPDGGVPLETVDNPPMPKKTPWDADSYKGPFSAKFWVKVNSAGVLEKAIPLEASDPILLPYLRRAMSGWAFRPARVNGGSADSWNELHLSGQVTYKVELKQIASLRRSLFGS